ncbi:hypothetical protein MLD38_005239 [Melastoma candidum]|uniref:Uncharacterized protein n=1 Tax=Melastoma candidum TaxID=119954 RepID=A0ACB9SA49_9MYRT|nr:hypothetical protein MLD38_005239 [Melastoma candidum]
MIGFVHPRGCGHLVAKHSQISFPVSVSRANQFDAASFDVEMSAMLEEQLVKVFSLTKECCFNMCENFMLSLSS